MQLLVRPGARRIVQRTQSSSDGGFLAPSLMGRALRNLNTEVDNGDGFNCAM